MIYNTERAGRSAYYERPAKERKSEREFAEDENLPELHEGELHGDVRTYEE